MAITQPAATPEILTYEQYMAEGEVQGRYDIVNGVRIFMAAPTRRHQRIQFHINLINACTVTRRRAALALPFRPPLTFSSNACPGCKRASWMSCSLRMTNWPRAAGLRRRGR